MHIGTYQNKLRLFLLLDILWRETDEQHALSHHEIEEYMQAAGFEKKYERKTFYDDIKALQAMDYDIEMHKKNGSGYYQLMSRQFELAEMKLLVDSVQAAKFISAEKSARLIDKLERMVSRYEKRALDRQVMIGGRIKTMNESIFYNVDTLHSAINAEHQIRFRYFMRDVDKNKVYRRDGDWYVVSPWGMLWDDENYYLVAYDEQAARMKHYRVDKMEQIEELEQSRVGGTNEKPVDFSSYNKAHFGMFTGELGRIGLVCTNDLIGVMLDRFGDDIVVQRVDDNHFKTYVQVAVSQQFFGWIAAFAGKARIVSPASAVQQMHDLAAALVGVHEQEGI